ncbi:MAG: hypothetical protein KAI89_02715 [Emcibacter sp.]|nr:hypothetical protein [Emcibacter sp.]
MIRPSITCPICGAKISKAVSAQDFTCPFCKFERRTAVGTRQENISNTEDTALPFQEDLHDYFHEKFHLMKPGETLHISTPVIRFLQKPVILPGQINFFRAKNIMFLLEQHGFKMAWRKNRFSSILNIIARRC